MDKKEKIYLISRFKENITAARAEAIGRVLKGRTRHICVVMEDIYQPHNISACLRSCECFGVQDVHIIENENEYRESATVDMGSAKWLSLHRYNSGKDNIEECVKKLKAESYRIAAMMPDVDDEVIDKVDITQKTAFLFGSEEPGLTEKAVELSDVRVRIPMYGFTQSFNISVSTALTLSSAVIRLRSSGFEWGLSPDEIIDLELDWLRKSVRASEQLEKEYLQVKEKIDV